MARPSFRPLLLTVAAVAAAGAAQAGTVYVPAPGPTTLGGSTYEVQVSIHNAAIAARVVKQTLLLTDTDGTQRTGTPGTLQVQPGRTVVVKAASSFRGLVELSGGAELTYAARLVGTGPGRLGVYLPAITSDTLIGAGKTTALQGLLAGSGRTADATLVNLAHQPSQCTLTLKRADASVISSVTVAMKALSQRTVADILGTVAASDVRLAVSCTQEFFAFALLSDAATGELAYIGPTGSGESTLRLPGEAPGCPVSATCFDIRGVVHQPTSAANAVRRVDFTPAAGTYRKIRLTMDVTAGPWWPQDPRALHMLFWLVKDKNLNMFGYTTFRGPGTVQPANIALLRHGIGLTHPQKLKVIQPFAAVPGKVYHLDYTYDTGTNFLELAISEGGAVVQRLTDKPNVGSFAFNGTEKILVDMGFPGTTPDEAPTFGWTYRDLHVELSK